MKTTLPPPSPTTPLKPDPFQRLSLAVKKLDQLINRTHQLGTLTNKLLREDNTGPSTSSDETDPTLPPSSHFATKLKKSECVSEK